MVGSVRSFNESRDDDGEINRYVDLSLTAIVETGEVADWAEGDSSQDAQPAVDDAGSNQPSQNQGLDEAEEWDFSGGEDGGGSQPQQPTDSGNEVLNKAARAVWGYCNCIGKNPDTMTVEDVQEKTDVSDMGVPDSVAQKALEMAREGESAIDTGF